MSAQAHQVAGVQVSSASLPEFVALHPRLFVLTGASCSTDSGIPDYRDASGGWKRPQPVTYQAFVGDAATRQRYWARSLVGWRRFGRAQPNATHHALARLERQGKLALLLTQNVDRLHQAAGSENVVDLHGRLDQVRCLVCERRLARTDFQSELLRLNPAWADLDAADAPDGDADLDGRDFSRFNVPPCPHCAGMLKPDVVFFGENVPRERVDAGMQALHDLPAAQAAENAAQPAPAPRVAMATPPQKPAAPPKPRAPTIAVVASGDDVISSPAEDALVSLLQSRGFRVIEGGRVHGDRPDLAALASRADAVVFVYARPVGSQELQYYGQSSTLYTVQLGVKAYRIGDGSVLWTSGAQQVNFTSLNAAEKAREAIEPMLDNVDSRLAEFRSRARRG